MPPRRPKLKPQTYPDADASAAIFTTDLSIDVTLSIISSMQSKVKRARTGDGAQTQTIKRPHACLHEIKQPLFSLYNRITSSSSLPKVCCRNRQLAAQHEQVNRARTKRRPYKALGCLNFAGTFLEDSCYNVTVVSCSRKGSGEKRSNDGCRGLRSTKDTRRFRRSKRRSSVMHLCMRAMGVFLLPMRGTLPSRGPGNQSARVS